MLWRRGERRALAGTVALYLLLPPGLIYLLSLPSTAFYTPATNARYFLLFVPAWYVLLGLCVAGWWRHWRGGAAVLAIALVALTGYFTLGYYDDRFKLDDYQTLTATIRAYAQPGDVIVLDPDTDWPVFLYHYHGDLPWVGLPHAEQMSVPEVSSLLEPVWTTHDRVWLVSSVKALAYDPEGNVPRWLGERSPQALNREYGEARLTLYTRQPSPAGALTLAGNAQPQRRIAVHLGEGLTLVGYDQWLDRVNSGQVVYLTFWWRTEARAQGNYGLRLALVGDTGKVAAARTGIAMDDALPTSAWTPSRTYRGESSFPIRVDVQSGRYHWLVEVVDSATGATVGRAVLGELVVVQTRRATRSIRAGIAHPVGARLGDEVALVGYDDHRPEDQANQIALAPGGELRLTLLWRALQPMEDNYTVFVHILGAVRNEERGNYLWGQRDAVPGNGDLPTTGWSPGEEIIDQYTVKLDDDAPAGEYQIEVGMYERTSGRRLPVTTAEGPQEGDRILLSGIVVR